MNAEMNEIYSPKLLIWMIDLDDAEANQDEIDRVYGENSVVDKNKNVSKNVKFVGPYEFFGHVEFNEILQELSRMGVRQVEEIDIYVDIADFTERMKGNIPKSGDIIRISYIETQRKVSDTNGFVWKDGFRHVFYEIGTITPVDLYNFKYINFHIYAEQTSLGNIPKGIIEYDNLEGTEPHDEPAAPWEENPQSATTELPSGEKDFNY